jgi:hypothetical protein
VSLLETLFSLTGSIVQSHAPYSRPKWFSIKCSIKYITSDVEGTVLDCAKLPVTPASRIGLWPIYLRQILRERKREPTVLRNYEVHRQRPTRPQSSNCRRRVSPKYRNGRPPGPILSFDTISLSLRNSLSSCHPESAVHATAVEPRSRRYVYSPVLRDLPLSAASQNTKSENGNASESLFPVCSCDTLRDLVLDRRMLT